MSVSEQIIQVIDDLCDRFGIAIDWTSENVIPYISTLCGKLIHYEICTSVFLMIFWVVLCVLCAILTVPPCKRAIKTNFTCDDIILATAGIGIIVSSIVLLVTIIVIGVQVHDIIEAVTFPEKTVVDYVTRVLNKYS